jgi:hypothetical protein
MRRTMTTGALLGLIAWVTADGPKAVEKSAALVAVTEKERTTALEHGDVAAVERILGGDLTYVHASGKVDSKASYLAAIRSDELHYLSWQPKTMHVRPLGEATVIDGEYLVRVIDRRMKPDPFDVNIFFLGVYAQRDGRWQMVAWQSTRDAKLSPLQ